MLAAIYVESRQQLLEEDGDTVDNRQQSCGWGNVRSIIALSPICQKAEETAPKIGLFLLFTLQTVFVLMETSHHP